MSMTRHVDLTETELAEVVARMRRVRRRRIGMLLSAAPAVFATVVVHGRLESKEAETDDG